MNSKSSESEYENFLVQEKTDESSTSAADHEDERPFKWLAVCAAIGVVIAICVCALVAIAIAIGVSVSLSSTATEEGEGEEGLTVISLTQGELEGKYLSSGSDGGIHFHSTVNDTYKMLTISTTDGKLVVSITQPLALSINMTLLDFTTTNLLIVVGQPGRPRYDDYVVPDQMMEVMEFIMRGDVEMSDSILRELDNSTVNETREAALRDLALSREAQLIIEAALTLGRDLKIIGIDYPSAFKFYQFALYLRIVRDSLIENVTMVDVNNTTSMTDYARGKRSVNVHRVNTAQRVPTNNKHNINNNNFGSYSHNRNYRQIQCDIDITVLGEDLQLPEDEYLLQCDECPSVFVAEGGVYRNDCHGMCGEACDCWSFLCTDCCAHNYCRGYQLCCAKSGLMSSQCFLNSYTGLGDEVCSEEYPEDEGC